MFWLTVCATVGLASGHAVAHPTAGASDFFGKLIAPLTAKVQAKYGTKSMVFSVVEVDACRFDPFVVRLPSGCMSMEPMDKLEDIGFLNVGARLEPTRILLQPPPPSHVFAFSLSTLRSPPDLDGCSLAFSFSCSFESRPPHGTRPRTHLCCALPCPTLPRNALSCSPRLHFLGRGQLVCFHIHSTKWPTEALTTRCHPFHNAGAVHSWKTDG